MRIVSPSKDATVLAFATKAAEHFRDNPENFTYAEGDPKPGELFAVRWNPYTVLVMELANDSDAIRLYPTHDLGLKQDLPKLAPKW